MRSPARWPALLLLFLVAGCGDDSGVDPQDTTPRFEFSEFRASPDNGCGIDGIEFSVLTDLRPARDILFELSAGGVTLEQGLLRSTLFPDGGRLLVVRMEARRIRERLGYGPHTVSIEFRESAGDPPRSAGPLTTSYEAKNCG